MNKPKYFNFTFALFALLSFSFTLKGQDSIPNAGMESWVNNLTYEDPTGWTTLNPLASLLAVELAFKANDPTEVHSGNYAAKLVTKMVLADITPSLLTTGTVNTVTQNIDGGLAIQSRPDVLSGWYQYAPSGLDSALFHIHLTKWNTSTNSTDEIGSADMTVSAATTGWTYFELAISYATADIPDTVQHLFVSSSNFAPQLNSTLWLDDFAYTSQVGMPILETSTIDIHPNPATDFIYIRGAKDSDNTISVYDAVGRLVIHQVPFSSEGKLNIMQLPKGIYIVEVASPSGEKSRKKFTKN